jgi:glutaredoxin
MTIERAQQADEISVYWQTGCTACLRTKEFLTRHGVPFRSRNVLEDPAAFDELKRFGLRQVPIVTRGNEWVNGQVLADVARVAGIALAGDKMLPVAELRRRLDLVLATAERLAAQIPADSLQTKLPNRPRSYANLVYHIFNIADAFVEHGEGIPLVYESYDRVAATDRQTNEHLVAYGRNVQQRLADWFAGSGRNADFNARADVYYGEQTLHQFLERTTWHSAQHTRQLTWVLRDILRIAPNGALPESTFEDLPMPVKVWDDGEFA